ncbi:MAG: hypothetical protein HZB53_18720 [Chloroflexi bacterium]|nr:hypothetical protein [Chloroflexota bacterium]
MMIDFSREFQRRIIQFVLAQRQRDPGVFVSGPGGIVTLSASIFAAMTLHYIGALQEVSTADERRNWADFINGWQDPNTGLYNGPEIARDDILATSVDSHYLAMHLTGMVLPALELLGQQPRHRLAYIDEYADPDNLLAWLNQRDFRNAWLEGNKLLIVGQGLTWLADKQSHPTAAQALTTWFDWLDSKQDPRTGLWGTDLCDAHTALYGAAHQLIVYFYHERPVKYAERIIDTILALQHTDGGFHIAGGGGACEDVDAIDTLVNLYQRTGYRAADVKSALKRALGSILDKQMPDGGFVYRRYEPYAHGSMTSNWAGPEASHLFATWYRVQTIGFISQEIRNQPLATINWQFNHVCSMGWHDSRAVSDSVEPDYMPQKIAGSRRNVFPMRTRAIRAAISRLPARWIHTLLRNYGWSLPANQSIRFLLSLRHEVERLIDQRSYEYETGLHPRYWHSHEATYVRQFVSEDDRWLVLGETTGTMSFNLAPNCQHVVALSEDRQAPARYRYPNLKFSSDIPSSPAHGFTAILILSIEEVSWVELDTAIRTNPIRQLLWADRSVGQTPFDRLEYQLADPHQHQRPKYQAVSALSGFQLDRVEMDAGVQWVRWVRQPHDGV